MLRCSSCGEHHAHLAGARPVRLLCERNELNLGTMAHVMTEKLLRARLCERAAAVAKA